MKQRCEEPRFRDSASSGCRRGRYSNSLDHVLASWNPEMRYADVRIGIPDDRVEKAPPSPAPQDFAAEEVAEGDRPVELDTVKPLWWRLLAPISPRRPAQLDPAVGGDDEHVLHAGAVSALAYTPASTASTIQD